MKLKTKAFPILLLMAIPVIACAVDDPPAVDGIHLGDNEAQVISALGAGESLPMAPGVFTMLYENNGISLILSDQSGMRKVEQIEAITPDNPILGVHVGQNKSDIEQVVGSLTASDSESVNTATLTGNGWKIHFVFDDQNILQRYALVKHQQTTSE